MQCYHLITTSCCVLLRLSLGLLLQQVEGDGLSPTQTKVSPNTQKDERHADTENVSTMSASPKLASNAAV